MAKEQRPKAHYMGQYYRRCADNLYVSNAGILITNDNLKYPSIKAVRYVPVQSFTGTQEDPQPSGDQPLDSWVMWPPEGPQTLLRVREMVEGLFYQRRKGVKDTFPPFDGNPISPFGDYKRLYPILKRQVEKAITGFYVPNRAELVEDILHDSFLRCHQYFHSFDPTRGSSPSASLVTWCARVTWMYARTVIGDPSLKLRDKIQYTLEENTRAHTVPYDDEAPVPDPQMDMLVSSIPNWKTEMRDNFDLLGRTMSFQERKDSSSKLRAANRLARSIRREMGLESGRVETTTRKYRADLDPKDVKFIRENYPHVDMDGILERRVKQASLEQGISLRCRRFRVEVQKKKVKLVRYFDSVIPAIKFRNEVWQKMEIYKDWKSKFDGHGEGGV
jgi:hypothetical protein